ncbi:MAG TPA: hypothetical protein VLJ68_00910 [Chitinophagaceae bacterium]|nr:hypothetical protein [Chitinophagaceae bacterium]
MQRQFILLLIISFLFASCQKTPTVVVTNTDRISASSWKFDHATSGGVDVTSSVPACLKDNVYVFNANGTGSVDESLSICSPSTAGAMTWNFQTNETILHISAALFPGGANDFTLVSLNTTNLVVSQVMTIPPNPPTTVEVTFKH